MNRDQITAISNWLLNISVGVVLAGAIGPNIIETQLRYPLWPTTLASAGFTFFAIILALYMRRS